MIARKGLLTAVLMVVVLAGCTQDTASPAKPAAPAASAAKANPEVAAALAKLSADDRKLAEAQKTCPVTGEPLGSMGVPPKLTIKGEPVFVCCASCKKDAEAEPDKTLKAVADSKAK